MTEPTIIVAGLTRSGLSLTMQMLHAGGFPCAGEPPAFEPYPVGEIPWDKVRGHAVKVVDTHLHFPPEGRYKVIRLRRDLKEQAKSLNKVGNAFGMGSVQISRLVGSLRRDYRVVDQWARQQEEKWTLDFEKMLDNPRLVARLLGQIVERELDVEAMESVVVSRSPQCFDGFLELSLIEGADGNG